MNTAANTEVQISLPQEMESLGFKPRREIAGLYCGSVEFLRTLQTDAHNGHINLHPQQCIQFLSLPIFSNSYGRFLDDIHSDWDEVGVRWGEGGVRWVG